MQAERTEVLIQSVLDKIEALEPNEAIYLPGNLVVARAPSGKLRVGPQWAHWFRMTYPVEWLRACLRDSLDRTKVGYDAATNARNLQHVRAVPGTVGRDTFFAEPMGGR